jgi:hypothetical protein
MLKAMASIAGSVQEGHQSWEGEVTASRTPLCDQNPQHSRPHHAECADPAFKFTGVTLTFAAEEEPRQARSRADQPRRRTKAKTLEPAGFRLRRIEHQIVIEFPAPTDLK